MGRKQSFITLLLTSAIVLTSCAMACAEVFVFNSKDDTAYQEPTKVMEFIDSPDNEQRYTLIEPEEGICPKIICIAYVDQEKNMRIDIRPIDENVNTGRLLFSTALGPFPVPADCSWGTIRHTPDGFLIIGMGSRINPSDTSIIDNAIAITVEPGPELKSRNIKIILGKFYITQENELLLNTQLETFTISICFDEYGNIARSDIDT